MLGVAAVLVPTVAATWLMRHLGVEGTALAIVSPLVVASSGLAGYHLYVHYIERRPATELDPKHGLRMLPVGLITGLLLFGATISILSLLGTYRVIGTNSPTTVLAPLAAAIAAGIFEELIFRGVVFRIIEISSGTRVALLLSAALFGLIHLINPHATLQGAIAIIFEAGILLAAAFVLTQRLWFPIGMHIGWNFAEGGLFGVSVSGGPATGLLKGTLTGPTWLTGGDFGPEASVVAIAVCTTVAAAFLLVANRRGLMVTRTTQRSATLPQPKLE